MCRTQATASDLPIYNIFISIYLSIISIFLSIFKTTLSTISVPQKAPLSKTLVTLLHVIGGLPPAPQSKTMAKPMILIYFRVIVLRRYFELAYDSSSMTLYLIVKCRLELVSWRFKERSALQLHRTKFWNLQQLQDSLQFAAICWVILSKKLAGVARRKK